MPSTQYMLVQSSVKATTEWNAIAHNAIAHNTMQGDSKTLSLASGVLSQPIKFKCTRGGQSEVCEWGEGGGTK